MFETASSKVGDHLFSMTHLPEAKKFPEHELLLKRTFAAPRTPTIQLAHTHIDRGVLARVSAHTHTHARAHVLPTPTKTHTRKTLCGSECCSCMSSRVELCGEDL